MRQTPFFSIVIANYNYGDMIGDAIESILHQNCDDYEIIVVDGGSKDNSVDVIKRYEKHISWWVSEPDKGQSNAFNKGFSHANGKFLTWLNADDIFLPGTLMAVKNALISHPDASWATGNLVRFLNDGKIIDFPWGPNVLPQWLQGPGRVTVVFGPTTFWSRKSYEALGPIDESLHYTMDTDYWCRLNMAGYKQVRVNHACWGFRMHEYSKTAEYDSHELSDDRKSQIKEERLYVIEKNHYNPSVVWRLLGVFMRCIDGSALKTLYNKYYIKGQNIKAVFGVDYVDF